MDCRLNQNKRWSCPCPGGDMSQFPDLVITLDNQELVLKPEKYIDLQENECIL